MYVGLCVAVLVSVGLFPGLQSDQYNERLTSTHILAMSCALPHTHVDTHIHAQVDNDRCLACWHCYPLPSQHMLLKTFAVLAVYYTICHREGDQTETEVERKTYSCQELCWKDKKYYAALFLLLISSENVWLINNVNGACVSGLVNRARPCQDELW